MWIVATGNPFDGIEIWGPFDTNDAAIEWATANGGDYEDWNVVEVTNPDMNDEPAPTWTVMRYFANHPSEVIKTGLTYDEAKAHCADPETSSNTAKSMEARHLTLEKGDWFDGRVEE